MTSLSFRHGLIFCAFLTLGGCDSTKMWETGPMQSSDLSVNKDAAEYSDVRLDLKAGELKLSGGSDKLIQGKFDFNVASYRPKVTSAVNGSHAAVTIEQPKDSDFGNNGHNVWDLQLNDKAILNLTLNCGAGQAEMNMGSLNLRSLQVHMGAGKVDLDLSGHPQRDYDVELAGGVGEATIHLPQGVGIRADVHGGLGSVSVSGLEKKDDHYENSTYDTAKVNVRLKITGGIGEIRIVD